MGRPKRVGVIGSGLAGLTAAYQLSTASRSTEDGSATQSDPLFEVHLFERSSKLGMDSASIEVPLLDENGDRTTFHLDTPMRAVQGGYYTRSLALYHRLGIRLHTAGFNYSFFRIPSLESTDPPTKKQNDASFIYEGGNGLRLRPLGVPAHLTSSSSPRSLWAIFVYLFGCVLITLAYAELVLLAGCSYHARHCRTLFRGTRRRRLPSMLVDGAAFAFGEVGRRVWRMGTDEASRETLEEWCTKWRISRRMKETILEPLFCCVCTCSREEVLQYPAEEILDYIWLTFGAEHYVCADGVHSVVEALSAPLPPSNVHTGPSGSIRRLARTTNGAWSIETDDGASYEVDRVVCATQANQARTLLETSMAAGEKNDTTGERLDALDRFQYCRTLVVNHFDEGVLPSSDADLRDLNIALAPPLPPNSKADPSSEPVSRVSSSSQSPPPSYSASFLTPNHVMATHVISRTHPQTSKCAGRAGKKLLQTTNPTVPIEASMVLSETWFERVKVTRQSKAALRGFLSDEGTKRARLQGIDGLWFCGSWCAEGIPLLEGCVRSAERVVDALLEEEQS